MADEPKKEEEAPNQSTLKTDSETGKEEVPKDLSPETKEAFIKMRQEIKALKDQQATRQEVTPKETRSDESLLWQPPIGTQADGGVDRQKFYNPDTGEFDFQAYDNEVQRRMGVLQAEQAEYTRNLVQEETDVSRARVKYPQLDPMSDEYDSDFDKEVASRYYFDKHIQGKRVSVTETAREVAKKANLEEKEKQKKEQVVEGEKEIAQAETSAQTTVSQDQQSKEEQVEEEERLRWVTRGILPEVIRYDSFGNPIRRKVSETEQTAALIARLNKKSWRIPKELKES